jgi:protein-disulfide isomerase
MPRCLPPLIAWLLIAARCVVAAPPAPAAESVETLQRQIDELRHGQEQLLGAMAELREQLKALSDRHETAALPEAPPVIVQNIRGEPFRGDPSARVAVIEYSDFNCSYCNRFVTNVFPQIDREWIQTGRIRWLFRDLPESGDKDSQYKAQAARCAWDQGKFWEMHDRLFQSPGPLLDNPAALATHAQALQLDLQKLSACLKTEKWSGPIRRISANARQFGLHGTPSFLIGRLNESGEVLNATKVVVGAESFAEFRTNLDEFVAAPK